MASRAPLVRLGKVAGVADSMLDFGFTMAAAEEEAGTAVEAGGEVPMKTEVLTTKEEVEEGGAQATANHQSVLTQHIPKDTKQKTAKQYIPGSPLLLAP